MFCVKCGKELDKGVNFCTSCGTAVGNNNISMDMNNNNNNNNINNMNNNTNNGMNNNMNNNMNSNINNNNNKPVKNYGNTALIYGIGSLVFPGVVGIVCGVFSIIYSKKEVVPSKDGKIAKILGIIGIVFSIIYGLFIYPNIENILNNLMDEFGVVKYDDAYGNDNDSSVKGTYTREIFSGNSFTYKTLFDTAVFKFDVDSRFEVEYESGQKYVGTYEVYNGANITIKANLIRGDESINGSDDLADNIIKLSEKMMEKEYVNTYLLWIKTDSGVLQPFMIEYNEDSKTGTAVNVYAAEQGSFTLN